MGKTTKYTERRFLGVLPENASKEQVRFHQRHEQAYLKGHERFRFGYEKAITEDGKMVNKRDEMGNLIHVWYPVQQEVIIDEAKKKLLTGK